MVWKIASRQCGEYIFGCARFAGALLFITVQQGDLLMKKRLYLFFVLLLACMCLILTLTACGEDKHIHTPKSAVRENEVPATCTASGSCDEVFSNLP